MRCGDVIQQQAVILTDSEGKAGQKKGEIILVAVKQA